MFIYAYFPLFNLQYDIVHIVISIQRPLVFKQICIVMIVIYNDGEHRIGRLGSRIGYLCFSVAAGNDYVRTFGEGYFTSCLIHVRIGATDLSGDTQSAIKTDIPILDLYFFGRF